MTGKSSRSSKRPGYLLDVEAAAELLAVPVRQVYRLVQRDEVPCYRVGRHLRFDRQELLEALRRGPGGEGGNGRD